MAYRRRIFTFDHDYDYEPHRTHAANYPSDEVYLNKMHAILSATPCVGVPPDPSPIMGTVYLGSSANAENIPLLKSLGIKYLLNCAGGRYCQSRRLRQMYGPETGVLGYEELPLEDSEHAFIRSYFDRAYGYIEHARSKGGRVLVFCPGVSRSGAVYISYLIKNGYPLLEATRMVKDERRTALVNVNFMRQIVEFARERGMLDADVSAIQTRRYGNPEDKYRLWTAHLPTML